MATHWEYMCLDTFWQDNTGEPQPPKYPGSQSAVLEKLNELGANGWEVCGTMRLYQYEGNGRPWAPLLLKRPLPVE